MVKKPSIRQVVRDASTPHPRFRGAKAAPRPASEDTMGHMNQDRGQGDWCRQSPVGLFYWFIGPQEQALTKPLKAVSHVTAASYNRQYQTWAMVFLDQHKDVQIETSPDLTQHQRQLLTPELRQIFLQLANMPEPVVGDSMRGRLQLWQSLLVHDYINTYLVVSRDSQLPNES